MNVSVLFRELPNSRSRSKRSKLFFPMDSIEEDELVENATQGPIRLNEEGDKKDCVIQ